jgi:hypothetical protein
VLLIVATSLTAWVGVGLLASTIPSRFGYHRGRWRVAGAGLGPLVLAAWTMRHRRPQQATETVEPGWPPGTKPGLLVVPTRGPTPELVRAIGDLRVHTGHVAVARVLPFDAPRRDVDRDRVHLRGDRAALGLPAATLVLLRGTLASAVVAHAEATGISLVLIDGEINSATGAVRIVRPEDVHPARRAPAVRILGRSKPVDLAASRLARRASTSGRTE